jgi:hypothetical protein
MVRTADFPQHSPARQFVIDHNIRRRHLDASQLAMVANKLATMQRGRPESNSSGELFTQKQAAAMLGISTASVKRAKIVQDKGVPERVGVVLSPVCSKLIFAVA